MYKEVYTWRVYLKPNTLGEEGESLAVVESRGEPATVEDMAEELASCSLGIHKETVIASYRSMQRIKGEFLLSGRSVDDGLQITSPVVRGVWRAGVGARNRGVTFTSVLTRSFSQLLKKVRLRVVDQKESEEFARINWIRDLSSDRVNEVITINDEILISGDRIKIVCRGSDGGRVGCRRGELESGLGVFFISSDNKVIPAARINRNETSLLSVRVPKTLKAGVSYRVRVVTRYTTNSTKLLNTPRVVEYRHALPAIPSPE
jgi:hypothetical protein